MKSKFISSVLSLLIAAVWVAQPLKARADLTHRYSFATDASDSVGTAHGTLVGNAAVDSGIVNFEGTSGTFVDLPAGMISNYTSVTFEFWANVGANGNWCELYAFGDRNPGGNGRHMVMFTPHSGAGDYRMSYADADPGFNHEFVVTQPGVLDGVSGIHVTCVYDPPNHYMGIYTNGILAASRSDLGSFFSLTNVWNVHSWLGQSLYAPDAPFTGAIDEFRIYNNALNAVQIAGSHVGGPDTASTDPGPVSALHLSTRAQMIRGSSFTPTATADFAQIQGVNLIGVPGVTYESSNPSVASVTNGVINAVGLGSANITLKFQNESAVQSVTVISDLPTVLQNRYSFTTDASDSVGAAHGTLVNNAVISGGAVVLDGQDSYVDLPNNLLTNLDSITMETWVTDTGSANWARIWDFGNSSDGENLQGGGLQYLFLSLPSGFGNLRGSHRGSGAEQTVEWIGGRPPVGQATHIVWTEDGSFHIGKLFVDGLLVGINTNFQASPRDLGPTVNDWLGRSQFNDPSFTGSIDEFRIYDGALTALQIALDSAAGPDSLGTNSPGTLQSVHLTLGTNQVIFGGLPSQILLMGDFQNVTNVNLTSVDGTAFQSSSPGVLSVNSNGLLTAKSLGSATLTGSYGGKSATLSITTVTPPGHTEPVLVHRYSFSETPGSTTVKDSVGSADGTIVGTGAVFDGNGQLVLPGGTSSSADPAVIAAYVDLPNHIINVLTNATFEAWVTWQGSGPWQRIFDFGTSLSGEDVSTGNGNYIFLTPQGDVNLHYSARDPVTGGEPAPLNGPGPMITNTEILITAVYDYTANVARLYTNAVLVASGQAPVALTGIDDVNNWLGRSQWPDALFQGKYNEFRIWNGALLPDQVAADYAAGPDSVGPSGSAPKLTVSQTDSASLVFSWPASEPGFTLQGTGQLGSNAQWTAVSVPPVVVNGQNTVTLPPNKSAEFFRLIK